MRLSWPKTGRAAASLALSFALLGGAAQAEPAGIMPDKDGPSITIGIICNTSDQAKQFVTLRSNGREAEPAMNAVNTEAGDPRACGVAAIVFIRDQTMDIRKMGSSLVQIVRINVVAGFNGVGWQRIPGMIQYAVIEGEGETI